LALLNFDNEIATRKVDFIQTNHSSSSDRRTFLIDLRNAINRFIFRTRGNKAPPVSFFEQKNESKFKNLFAYLLQKNKVPGNQSTISNNV
jgi:hypothetical protein